MDYYNILGVDRGASQEEIKKAYRNLAKMYHPDVNSEPDAETKFKEVSEAYDVLSDEQKKSNYDNYGDVNGPTHFNFHGGTHFGFDFSNVETIFEQFFGTRHRQPMNTDLNLEVSVPPQVLLNGSKINVAFNRIVCDSSNNRTTENHTTEINIPANCPLLATLQIANLGNQEHNNLPPGNLYVKVNVALDPSFRLNREGDVFFKKDITFDEWANNHILQLDRFGVEKVTCDLSKLKNSEEMMVFEGKGLRNSNNTKQGNFVVDFRISK